jgi:uncharacterized protein DUF5818
LKKAIGLLGLTIGLSVSAMAANVTGYIIDEMCSSKAAMKGDVACANKCIKAGSPAVLVTDDGKVYKLSDQAKAVPLAGEKVTVSGNVKGDTIEVASIKK